MIDEYDYNDRGYVIRCVDQITGHYSFVGRPIKKTPAASDVSKKVEGVPVNYRLYEKGYLSIHQMFSSSVENYDKVDL